jgi:hypothetical protein
MYHLDAKNVKIGHENWSSYLFIFGCKITHWKAYSKLDQVLIGHFCKFLIDSLAFLFLSKVSINLGQREYLRVEFHEELKTSDVY